MHVERRVGLCAKRLDDWWTERQIRHEVAVHHVEVDKVSAALYGLQDLLAKPPEVGGEYRGRDP